MTAKETAAFDVRETADIDRPRRCVEIEHSWDHYFSEDYDWRGGKPAGNRASVLCHVCENYALLYRRHYDEIPRPSNHVLGLFRQGRAMETDTAHLLEHELGIAVRRADHTVEWKQIELTGHIDREIQLPGDTHWYIGEIKCLHPMVFARINEVRDFWQMSWNVFRQYPGQLLLYLVAEGDEKGLFVIRDKSSSDLKALWMYTEEHLGYAEELAVRAESINLALGDGTPNLRKINDPDVCTPLRGDRCPFFHHCMPDLSFAPDLFVLDHEWADTLERRGELEPRSKEFGKLDARVKSALKRVEWTDRNLLHVGPWTISRMVKSNGAQQFDFNRLGESAEPEEEDSDD